MSSAPLHWAPDVFENGHNALRFGDAVPDAFWRLVQPDLAALLVVPTRNDKSRGVLAQGEAGKPVALPSGEEYVLNKPFIALSCELSALFDLDELCAAELLQCLDTTTFAKGLDLLDAGVLAFFRRYAYIVSIVGYLVLQKRLNLTTHTPQSMLKLILASFDEICKLVRLQHESIDRQKATGDVNALAFVQRVAYVREQLVELHGTLAQVLFSLLDTYTDDLGTWDSYAAITEHINKSVKSDADILLLHYLPSLMTLTTSLLSVKESQVEKFHQKFSSTLTADYSKVATDDVVDISKSLLRTYELVVQLVFYIAFIPWCKAAAKRSEKYDFEKDILKYVDYLICYGTFEQILCYTAETAPHETKVIYEQSNLFDFRPLLQRSFPRLEPALFIYPGTEELLRAHKLNPSFSNIPRLCDCLGLAPSPKFSDNLVAPFFHTFFSTFINHAAIVLTVLRDNEEDFLLSSSNRRQLGSASHPSSPVESQMENAFDNSIVRKSSKAFAKLGDASGDIGVDLDEIAQRAELERFYMACVYTYSNRPELCEAFWNAEDSNILGFINWGLANNTSPLITATFCLLLGSLTSGGNSSSAKVWDILVSSHSVNTRRNDYSRISIDSIINSLTYYIDALTENLEADLSNQAKRQQKKQEFLFSGALNKLAADELPFSIQLSEDSVVFIAGFFMLVSAIVKNTKSTDDISQNVQQAAFNRFSPIIIAFLKFDNLITSAKATHADSKIPSIFNDENRTAIINLIMNLLADFAEGDYNLKIRNKIWVVVDGWICHSLAELETNTSTPAETSRYAGVSVPVSSTLSVKTELSKLRQIHRGVSMKQGFQIALSSLSEVTNFVRLMEALLRPVYFLDLTSPLTLLYPSDLGGNYRQNNKIGVWPYIEFLLVEVFGRTAELKSATAKFNIRSSILNIITSSLNDIDWTLFNDIGPKVLLNELKLNETFAKAFLMSGESTIISYTDLVRLHHSLAVMNYLFEESTNKVLFEIIISGSETLSKDSKLHNLVRLALETLNQTLLMQNTFIDSLLPILKRSEVDDQAQLSKPMGYGTTLSLALSTPKARLDNVYYPDNLGTKGVLSFFEVILFHISTPAQIALYVGNSSYEIAHLAIKILGRLSTCPLFMSKGKLTDGFLLEQSRLLTIFKNIDESTKIKYSFVQQIESVTDSLTLKYEILQFLIDNLPDKRQFTVAHFLLGYDIKAMRLELNPEEQGFMLLKSLLEMLPSTLSSISEIDYSQSYHHVVEVGPVKLTALILEVIVRLCRNPISSAITLNYIRKFDLFSALLDKQPGLDDMTVWNENRFNGDVRDEINNEFVSNAVSLKTFLHFVNYRNLAIQYLSLEFHDIKSSTCKEKYVELLLDSSDFLNGTPKVLNFLDVLNFQFYNFEEAKFADFSKKYNLHVLLAELKSVLESEEEGSELIQQLTNLKCLRVIIDLPSDDDKILFIKSAQADATEVETLLRKFLAVAELKALHSKTLHSWVQMIQVLTHDGVAKKTDFILRVMQVVLPKVNGDYYERDIFFAEELISLCVFLFDLYEEETLKDDKMQDLHRLLPLFKTCVNGLLSSNSTAKLRSDFYLLLNKFVQRGIKSEEMLRQILTLLGSADKKFIDVVCNDCIYSEGVPRITSMIFMESLIHLSIIEKSNSILDTMVNNNSLSLLVRFIKRADEIIFACSENASETSGIDLETLLYELTALKATLYLLIRIGQTRYGASQLVQNEVFSVIKQLKFLQVDPGMGLDFLVESDAHDNASIKLTLAVPPHLRDQNARTQDEQAKSMSYYEILVPAFQLVATVLLSMGPSYIPGIVQVQEIMAHHRQFVAGVMKHSELMRSEKFNEWYGDEASIAHTGLKQLVKLLTLVDSVVDSEKSGDGAVRTGRASEI